jgi:hypothetical protein
VETETNIPQDAAITAGEIKWSLDSPPEPMLPPENDPEALIARLIDLTRERDVYRTLASLAITEVHSVKARNARLRDECQQLRKAA